MPNKDTFYQRTFLCKNGKVYAYGYENDSAYVYSIANQTWTKKIPNNWITLLDHIRLGFNML